ncbi:DUF4405 domain-containing protein [Bosea caraganae]|uniref:DUF4405 domain-containing protein n=1 Tax=Bosea caraganae TaxID=2763117 RepID=A0A370L9E7_9HYPH|nr:DUF4405 domain-containing protein [Bosea caraganae]RDJ22040.1 DUF4405 domain-containing protein [Bosea caraganae]RDJ27927.1 DUF4405 domain-containing protein [Bosea caraganae]
MSAPLIVRLALDFLAASSLLFAFAYNWIGNAVHEFIGAALFVLLISHNVFNRRWYGTITKRRREPRGIIAKMINLSLLAAMLALLVTSIVISQTVFSFLPLTSSFTARQLHTLVGYLVLLVVSIHLGMSWSLIMGALRARLGLVASSRLRTYVLRTATVMIAAYGVHSLFVVKIGSKLSMQVPMDFGSFQVSTPALLVHHVAIVGLGASLAHFAVEMIQGRRDRRPSGAQNSRG